VYAANPLFERLLPDVARDHRERLTLMNAAADTLFAQALARLDRGGDRPSVQSIPLSATDQHVAMIVHLLPVCGAAHDIFSQSQSIVVITPIDRNVVPTAQVLQGLFDLTPAEARVARGIGEGQTLETLADSLGLSRETLRAQLRSVMAKTGVSRQAELAALLAGAALKGGA
jgi:DNA-binding CsgD family transcriptional regulator